MNIRYYCREPRDHLILTIFMFMILWSKSKMFIYRKIQFISMKQTRFVSLTKGTIFAVIFFLFKGKVLFWVYFTFPKSRKIETLWKEIQGDFLQNRLDRTFQKSSPSSASCCSFKHFLECRSVREKSLQFICSRGLRTLNLRGRSSSRSLTRARQGEETNHLSQKRHSTHDPA